jgi:uncharacterized protein (DUF1499 family)
VVLAVLALVLVAAVGLSLAARRRPPSGLVDGRLRPCPDTPNCVSSQSAVEDQAVRPMRFEGDPQEAFARLVGLVDTLPRTVLLQHDEGYAHFEVTTALLRFRDDLELQLDATAGVIHLRSCSRVGRSDLGTNRRRVEAIRGAFEDR